MSQTNLSITASQVQPGTTANGAQFTSNNLAGASIAAGQMVTLNSATPQAWVLANSTTLALSGGNGPIGVACNNAAVGQSLNVQTGGLITLGAAAAIIVGQIYCLSETSGDICLGSDPTTGDYVVIVGIGTTASTIYLYDTVTSIVHA
jgi:hypothetical protein